MHALHRHGNSAFIEAAHEIEVMATQAPQHLRMVMAGDFNVSFSANMIDGFTIGPSIIEREKTSAGRVMTAKALRQRLRLKAMNTFNATPEATRWPRTPRGQPTMTDYVTVLEDREHDIIIERKKIEFANTDRSLLRMKTRHRSQILDKLEWEEAEEFIATASEKDYPTHFAERPRNMVSQAEPRSIKNMMREKGKPSEVTAIDENVEQWRSFLLEVAKKYPKRRRRETQGGRGTTTTTR